jgi:dTDP-glucose 4,6-dehydratase
MGIVADNFLASFNTSTSKAINCVSTRYIRPMPENNPLLWRPDIGKAKRLLGWEPVVGLDDGLKLTIEWFDRKTVSCD